MLSLKQKNQFEFGSVSPKDDQDIEVVKLKRAAKQGLWFESFRLIRDVILIVSVFVLFIVFVAQPVVVDGSSMVPELQNGERLIVNKLVYYNIKSFSWGHIERGDIVVFWYPHDPSKSFVKRVIGLPGEEVEIRDGQVFINGQLLQEPYLSAEKNQSIPIYKSTQVKDHHYFVMGDNRDNSLDSRRWGLVPEKYIYGKAFFRYWKPSNLGFLRKGETQLEKSDDMEEHEDDMDEDYRATDEQ